MVKKTYITPEALTVVLGSKMQMMTASNPDVTISTSAGGIDAAKVEAKEVGDVNVWDEEW